MSARGDRRCEQQYHDASDISGRCLDRNQRNYTWIMQRTILFAKITCEKRPVTQQLLTHQLTNLAFTIPPQSSLRLSSIQMAVSGQLNKEQNSIWQSLIMALRTQALEGDVSLRCQQLIFCFWPLEWKDGKSCFCTDFSMEFLGQNAF